MKVALTLLVLVATGPAVAQAQPVSGFYAQGSAGLGLPQQTSGAPSPPAPPRSSAAVAANAAINGGGGATQSGSAGWAFGNGLRVEVQGFHSAQGVGGGDP